MKARLVLDAFFRPSNVAEWARSNKSESRSRPITKRSSKGICPTIVPARVFTLADRQRNDVVFSNFMKRSGVDPNSFPASVPTDESMRISRMGSRRMVRFAEPVYFNSKPPSDVFEKVRLETAAPLIHCQRPLGTAFS